MKSITRKIRVSPEGWVSVQAPAELGNQEVDVIIIPRRVPAEERVAAWKRLCDKVQNLESSKEITEDEIRKEIEDYRAGQ
jgi:hypothetical protein